MAALEEGFIGKKYTLDSVPKKNPESWDFLEVTLSILNAGKKEKMGSYLRNYPHLNQTFYPFFLNGKELALYSPDYMYTRVMELPSCKDLGGEDENNVKYDHHFCPVEFYVPYYRKVNFLKKDKSKNLEVWLTGEECFEPSYRDGSKKGRLTLGPIQYCNFGFVAGCVWGDDSSWKIQFLDLSEADKGIIKRDSRFGYIQLPDEMALEEAIDLRLWEPDHPWIKIAHSTTWNYLTGEKE